tara:strand:- start:1096 stop:1818 length:723 start_codon:yes stop_codon:yes gene_type:complete
MEIIDNGFYLGSQDYGDNLKILQIFSEKNGVIKGITRHTKKKRFFLLNLDKINFSWSSKNKDGLGYINFELETFSVDAKQSLIFSLIKASASELCLKFLPSWQKNIEIYEDLEILSNLLKKNYIYIIREYILWELKFLKNLGYGLDFSKCTVSGSFENISFLSPKTGNSVCYEVGKKYQNRLFKIPKFLNRECKTITKVDYLDAFKITSYYIKKIDDSRIKKFIFRNQLLEKIKSSESLI